MGLAGGRKILALEPMMDSATPSKLPQHSGHEALLFSFEPHDFVHKRQHKAVITIRIIKLMASSMKPATEERDMVVAPAAKARAM